MSNILHIETATEICSVAIGTGESLLAIKEIHEPFKHTSHTTLLIQQCLDEAELTMHDLSAVAVSKGPGSYTGLRVGASIAKGICYAMDIPLIAVDTLASLAWATRQTFDDSIHIPMIDARRIEVYTAVYHQRGEVITTPQSMIIDQDSFSALRSSKSIVFSGNGAEKCRKVLNIENARFTETLCSAKHLISLAFKAFENQDFEDIAYFTPSYIKAPNITKPKKIL